MSLDRLGGKPSKQGNQIRTAVSDEALHELMCEMFIELKYIRAYLASMSGLELDEEDIKRGQE